MDTQTSGFSQNRVVNEKNYGLGVCFALALAATTLMYMASLLSTWLTNIYVKIGLLTSGIYKDGIPFFVKNGATFTWLNFVSFLGISLIITGFIFTIINTDKDFHNL